MGGIRIEGSSGNVADATSAGNLKVQLPTSQAESGSVRLVSEIDSGTYIGGSPILKNPEASVDYRLRVGVDSIVDAYSFAAGVSSKFILRNFTHQAPSAAGTGNSPLIFNSGSSVAAGYSVAQSRRTIGQIGNAAPIYVETTFLMTAVNNVNVYEFGLGVSGGSTPFSITDGIIFRITSAGVFGIVVVAGVETTTSAMSVSLNNNQYYVATIVIGNREAQFWIDDVAYCAPLTITANPFVIHGSAASWVARYGQTGASANAAQLKIAAYNIVQGDAFPRLDPAATQMLQHMGNGTFLTNTAQPGHDLFYNQAPQTGTWTAGSAPGRLYPGGHFLLPTSVSTGEADYPVFSINVPASAFMLTGIRVNELVVGSAVTGGPIVVQWNLTHAHTSGGLSVVSADSGVALAPRYIPLGFQVIPASATVGTLIAGFEVDFSAAPIPTLNNQYFTVSARFPYGTAITAGTIRGAITTKGYYVY